MIIFSFAAPIATAPNNQAYIYSDYAYIASETDGTSSTPQDDVTIQIPSIENIISLALANNYVLSARAYEWQGNIVLAVITTPFYLKSERDNAKLEIKNNIIEATNYQNIIITFDGEVFRNIRDNLDDREKKRLYELALKRS